MSNRGAVERIWYGDDALAGLARVALAPAAWAYGAAVGARGLLYDVGWLPSRAAAIPAISIGNLTVGGTGKTPITAWIAERLLEFGAKPAIVLRGYGADEPLVHQALNPSLPVIVDPDRLRGIARAASAGATVAVLDDAFQHRRAKRQLDIVLVSADQWTGETRLLPAGPWRESLSALRRASLAIVTRKAATDAQVGRVHDALSAVAPLLPRISVSLALGDLKRVGAADSLPLSGVRSREVRLIAGVGDPSSLIRQLESAGATVRATLFADHHAFTVAEVASFASNVGPDALALCTLKDAVKIGPYWSKIPQTPVLWYVTQRVVIDRGAGGLEQKLHDLVGQSPAPDTLPTAP